VNWAVVVGAIEGVVVATAIETSVGGGGGPTFPPDPPPQPASTPAKITHNRIRARFTQTSKNTVKIGGLRRNVHVTPGRPYLSRQVGCQSPRGREPVSVSVSLQYKSLPYLRAGN